MIDLDYLLQLQQKPAPFTPGEPHFWDDPHISKGLLATHLDPATDLASRRPETIDRSVAWLAETLGLAPGAAILDLGCGPGLYASRLAARGLRVTGVDLSPRSIAYAVEQAHTLGLDITYRCQNYLELADEAQYDAALLIYGDFCPLAPAQRARLLANVRRALLPGGFFVLDVSTRTLRMRYGARNRWEALASGFWRPGPHLVLEQGFDYPDEGIYLDQYVVVEPDGRIAVYRNWFQDYTAETIAAELTAGGVAVRSLWGDLAGAAYAEDGEWIGVVAQTAGI
jgi:SAM-dependent methyltransferase